MPIIGIDNAYPISDLAHARSLGYTFDMRYGPPSVYEMKQAECDNLHAHDFGVGHIFEVGGDRSLLGAGQGHADGLTLDAWATACGAPLWVRLVYVAEDKDMTVEQLRGPVTEYARAFDDACTRPTMPYGSYDAIEILCGEKKVAPYGWQTAGWSGGGQGSGGSFHCSDGSYRRLSRYTAMFQDVGYVLNGQADHNVVIDGFAVDWAWGGPYTQAPSGEEAEMPAMGAYVLWWTRPGSGFAQKAKVDNSVPQCFKVTDTFAQHVGTDPHDPVIEGCRFELQLAGFPKKPDGTSEKEARDQDDTYFWSRSIVYDTQMDGESYVPPGQIDVDALASSIVDELQARGMNTITDADIEKIAARTVELHGRKLVSESNG